MASHQLTAINLMAVPITRMVHSPNSLWEVKEDKGRMKVVKNIEDYFSDVPRQHVQLLGQVFFIYSQVFFMYGQVFSIYGQVFFVYS